MLVLSRRERERIKLGDSIVVTVVRVAGDKVRLGIEAPPHILVLPPPHHDQKRAILGLDLHEIAKESYLSLQ